MGTGTICESCSSTLIQDSAIHMYQQLRDHMSQRMTIVRSYGWNSAEYREYTTKRDAILSAIDSIEVGN